jgi:hypothetical protein
MTDAPRFSTSDVHAVMRGMLPHRSFTISTRRLDTRVVIVANCRCGRKLDMLDSLPSNILLWWLLDHDDDMFLTPGQLDAKRSATIAPLPAYDPDTALGAIDD